MAKRSFLVTAAFLLTFLVTGYAISAVVTPIKEPAGKVTSGTINTKISPTDTTRIDASRLIPARCPNGAFDKATNKCVCSEGYIMSGGRCVKGTIPLPDLTGKTAEDMKIDISKHEMDVASQFKSKGIYEMMQSLKESPLYGRLDGVTINNNDFFHSMVQWTSDLKNQYIEDVDHDGTFDYLHEYYYNIPSGINCADREIFFYNPSSNWVSSYPKEVGFYHQPLKDTAVINYIQAKFKIGLEHAARLYNDFLSYYPGIFDGSGNYSIARYDKKFCVPVDQATTLPDVYSTVKISDKNGNLKLVISNDGGCYLDDLYFVVEEPGKARALFGRGTKEYNDLFNKLSGTMVVPK